MRRLRLRWAAILAGVLAAGSVVTRAAAQDRRPAADAPRAGDDRTYRPTVRVHRGSNLGSGVVISSIEGETLVLTASHVLDAEGPAHIELFRLNLGLERERLARGFPRPVPATIAARDPAADIAILRIKGQLRFPFVARLDRLDEPKLGAAVSTIGFDGGDRLIGFDTQVRSIERIDLNRGGGDRPFIVTRDPPEHGRSGGGLFLADGTLVGVCVGKADVRPGRTIGIFSTAGNVRALIEGKPDLARALNRPIPTSARGPAGR